MDTRIAVVSGVGPGTGAAIARRFAAGGYRVAMLARDRDRLATLAEEVAGAHAFPCDVTDEVQLDLAVAGIHAQLGAPSVLIHNAVGGVFGGFLDVDPQVIARNFQVNVMGLLHLARRLAPGMHVAYLVIDAVIDLEWTRRLYSGAADDFFIQPAAIADELWHVAHQPRSAWSFNVEVRPSGESW